MLARTMLYTYIECFKLKAQNERVYLPSEKPRSDTLHFDVLT